MSWETSDRRSRLPANWGAIRRRILRRDGERCTWIDWIDGKRVRCPARATDVDHIRRGDDHGDANLRSLCEAHHDRKTAREAAAGMTAAARRKRAEIRKRLRRPVEEHPAYAQMKIAPAIPGQPSRPPLAKRAPRD